MAGHNPFAKFEAFSYEEQLTFLNSTYLKSATATPWQKRMLLSLCESVKDAQDHNLNCPRNPRGVDQS